MSIDNIAEEARFCKESRKPIIDGKCVCSGESTEKECGCQNRIDIRKILPFLIQNARFYKGFSL